MTDIARTTEEEPLLQRQVSRSQTVAIMPRIVIAGGSGQIGTVLARAFHSDGYDVAVLSRHAYRAPWRTVLWDGRTAGDWELEIDGADVVINMAGRSVNCRYNAENRRQIMDSRVDSTHALGNAIQMASRPPRCWLQASTATIYAHRYDDVNDEATGIIGGNESGLPETYRFSVDVAKRWEAAAEEIPTPDTRKVLLRSAMTMSADRGGIFDTLLGMVRRGLGGQSGDGRQFVSWIHGDDFICAVKWLIDRHDLSGAVNLTSPNPLPNWEFMKLLRSAWGTRIGLPASEAMLQIGAVFLKTETELILKSRRVVPGRLLDSGFTFQYPYWKAAAVDLCRRWRDQNG